MDNRDTNPDADMEPLISNAPLGANEVPKFDSPVRITFNHTRTRLADIDGLSGKAAIDGIVKVGILSDDSPKQVTEVVHTQTKGPIETTVITIEAVNE